MEKTPALQQEFDKAKERIMAHGNIAVTDRALGEMQEVIASFQKTGLDASLDIRPSGLDDKIAAGDISINGLVIGFQITQHEHGRHVRMVLSLDGIYAGDIYIKPKQDEFKNIFRSTMLDLVAERDLFAKHNVAPAPKPFTRQFT